MPFPTTETDISFIQDNRPLYAIFIRLSNQPTAIIEMTSTCSSRHAIFLDGCPIFMWYNTRRTGKHASESRYCTVKGGFLTLLVPYDNRSNRRDNKISVPQMYSNPSFNNHTSSKIVLLPGSQGAAPASSFEDLSTFFVALELDLEQGRW